MRSGIAHSEFRIWPLRLALGGAGIHNIGLWPYSGGVAAGEWPVRYVQYILMAIAVIVWLASLPYLFRMVMVVWWGLRGNRLSLRGDYEGALRAYEQGLRYFTTHVGLLYGRGVALRRLGRNNEALACYREVIEHHPQHYRSFYNIAMILRDKGDIGQAERAFLKAIEIHPNYPKAHANLAILYDKLDEKDKAIEYYAKYFLCGGNDPLIRERARRLGVKDVD